MPRSDDRYSSELGFARELAAVGADVALSHFMKDPDSKLKADGTWATEADLAAERRMRRMLARGFPHHNVLGEEQGFTAADGGSPHEGAPTWILDPIDGTNNFMAGIPVWATLVALSVEGRAVVGVCHAPSLRESYDAGVGMGARFNGEPIHVDEVSCLEDATVCLTGSESFLQAGLGTFLDELLSHCFRSRGFADFWGHALVARGAAHVMIETNLNLWDVAALQPIVSEAGGRITHLDGSPWTAPGNCLTTNGVLHDQVVELFDRSTTSSGT